MMLLAYTGQIIMPISKLTSGDCIGSISLVSKEANEAEDSTEEIEKILKIAASFLGKQVQ